MEVFVVVSVDSGFNPEVEGVFETREEAEKCLDFFSDEEKEFYIRRSLLE